MFYFCPTSGLREHSRLSLPKSRFVRIDGVARQGSDTQQCLRTSRSDVCRACPSQARAMKIARHRGMTTQSGSAHHEDQEVHRTRGAAFRIIWVHANVPSDAGANFLFKDNGSTRMVCLFISLVLRFASVSLAAYSYRIPGAVSSFPISSVRTELWLVAHG